MPPLYYTDTCVYVGYSFMTLFLASLFSACGAACAITIVDVVPRQKQIVQLQNNMDLFVGEIDIVRDEYNRRRVLEDELTELRGQLALAQGELQLERETLRIAKKG